MSKMLESRYEFVLLFDVQDGNPNGDPDAGNLPRVDPETGEGLVTDVCLKRKVRNYVALKHGYERPNDIYVKEKAVLGRAHFQAFNELGINLGEEVRKPVPAELQSELEEAELPEGVALDMDEEGHSHLTIAATTDKKEVQQWLKDSGLGKQATAFVKDTLKGAKTRKPRSEEREAGREQMCRTFFDIRTFGAVLSLKTAPNAGQVRGPVQITFARSIGPVVSLEHSITRMAVATEAEAEKQQGDNRTIGRKHTVPYGLYRAHGFVSAHLAKQTGFSEEDLELLWESLAAMFEHDRSAARGQMTTRGLYVFQHDNALGRAPAHTLFERVRVHPNGNGNGAPARQFSDFRVEVDDTNLPAGIAFTRRVG
jgi:CRISPR-associated protein Csd2